MAELRSFLKSKGAEVSEENAPEGLVKDLKQVMEASAVVWKDEAIKDAGKGERIKAWEPLYTVEPR